MRLALQISLSICWVTPRAFRRTGRFPRRPLGSLRVWPRRSFAENSLLQSRRTAAVEFFWVHLLGMRRAVVYRTVGSGTI